MIPALVLVLAISLLLVGQAQLGKITERRRAEARARAEFQAALRRSAGFMRAYGEAVRESGRAIQEAAASTRQLWDAWNAAVAT